MASSRKSIFDIERRSDYVSDFTDIMLDFENTLVETMSLGTMTLFKLLDCCIRTWPHRQGANSVISYANAHKFKTFNTNNQSDILYSYELFLNLLHWAPIYDFNRKTEIFVGEPTIDEECSRCIENIEYKLQLLNMRIRKIEAEGTPKYVISKRNANVDAVIESVPELSETLLSYLDIRNQNDETAKKSILEDIADHLEQRHTDNYYKGTNYSSLCENLFNVFNNASIRHQNKKQWKLGKQERINLYDKTFKAALHLLQMEDIASFNNLVNELKKSTNQ